MFWFMTNIFVSAKYFYATEKYYIFLFRVCKYDESLLCMLDINLGMEKRSGSEATPINMFGIVAALIFYH